MANGYNQYIGMRYVPIIDGEWSQSKAYEPLVVVIYNGNSYISKTYVPAGTLPTNETYWILAANYNAQVEQYRTEVREYQETVQGFSDSIDANTTAIGNINDVEIPADRARLTKLEQERTRIVDSYIAEDYTATVAGATLTQVKGVTLSRGIWVLSSYIDPGTHGDHIYYHRIGGGSIAANEMGGSNYTRIIENNSASYEYPIYVRMSTAMSITGHIEAVKIANLTL